MKNAIYLYLTVLLTLFSCTTKNEQNEQTKTLHFSVYTINFDPDNDSVKAIIEFRDKVYNPKIKFTKAVMLIKGIIIDSIPSIPYNSTELFVFLHSPKRLSIKSPDRVQIYNNNLVYVFEDWHDTIPFPILQGGIGENYTSKKNTNEFSAPKLDSASNFHIYDFIKVELSTSVDIKKSDQRIIIPGLLTMSHNILNIKGEGMKCNTKGRFYLHLTVGTKYNPELIITSNTPIDIKPNQLISQYITKENFSHSNIESWKSTTTSKHSLRDKNNDFIYDIDIDYDGDIDEKDYDLARPNEIFILKEFK